MEYSRAVRRRKLVGRERGAFATVDSRIQEIFYAAKKEEFAVRVPEIPLRVEKCCQSKVEMSGPQQSRDVGLGSLAGCLDALQK